MISSQSDDTSFVDGNLNATKFLDFIRGPVTEYVDQIPPDVYRNMLQRYNLCIQKQRGCFKILKMYLSISIDLFTSGQIKR